jgi:vitamin B12 transporter
MMRISTIPVLAIWIGLSASGSAGIAQTSDSTLSLPAVTILETPPTRTGYVIWLADTLPSCRVLSLADRLLLEMPLDIRVNAPGGLTTLSARGAGPSRTAVFWQGMNLQSPMNGVVDAALVPVWAGDAIDIQYGGQSSARSNGVMGGSVQITPAAWPDSSGVAAAGGIAAGSFGRREVQASLGFGCSRINSLVRAAYVQVRNDFPYKNTALIGAPQVKQVNNAVEKVDIQQFNRLKINDRNTLETAVWLQAAFREIPPAMTEAPAEVWQRDRALRAVANWTTLSGSASRWKHRLTYQQDYIGFHLPSDTDTSRSRTVQLSSEYVAAPGSRLLVYSATHAWLHQAQADGYADSARWFDQWRLAGWVLAEYHLNRIRLNAQLRQEWAEDQGTPFTGAVGAHWTPAAGLAFRLHLSRNFNLPTFNDRFWRHLGNPDLRPESGYSGDLSVSWQDGRWHFETSAFQLLLDDWILWQPGSDGLFRPGNLRRVWSRGVETKASLGLGWLGGYLQIITRFRLTRATNTAVYDANTGALHKILPYTPQQSAAATLLWSRGGWSVAYIHQYTGKRFTNADNSEAMPAFHAANALLRFIFNWSGQRFSVSGRLENCWNTAYQILAFRPLPGRAWQLGVQWSLR